MQVRVRKAHSFSLTPRTLPIQYTLITMTPTSSPVDLVADAAIVPEVNKKYDALNFPLGIIREARYRGLDPISGKHIIWVNGNKYHAELKSQGDKITFEYNPDDQVN